MAGPREGRHLSKIIKKALIDTPVSLPSVPFASFAGSSPENGRSLDFSGTIEDEIASWRERFASSRASHARDLERRTMDAWNAGYEKGFEEGLERERKDKIAAIETLLAEAKRKREKAVHDLEIQIVDLAVLIAERIIRKSLETAPDTVIDIIREAMSHIVSGETVVLKVSEEDLPAINERYEEWLGLSGNAREFRIEADRRLRRGDCLIETEGGIVDAVVANRLDFIAEEILKQE